MVSRTINTFCSGYLIWLKKKIRLGISLTWLFFFFFSISQFLRTKPSEAQSACRTLLIFFHNLLSFASSQLCMAHSFWMQNCLWATQIWSSLMVIISHFYYLSLCCWGCPTSMVFALLFHRFHPWGVSLQWSPLRQGSQGYISLLCESKALQSLLRPLSSMSAHFWREATRFFPPVFLGQDALSYFPAGCTWCPTALGEERPEEGIRRLCAAQTVW